MCPSSRLSNTRHTDAAFSPQSRLVCSFTQQTPSGPRRVSGPVLGREDADTSEHTQGQRLAVRTLPLAGAQPVGRARKKAVRAL